MSHFALVRRDRPRGFDEEARVVLRRFHQCAGANTIIRPPQEIVDAVVDASLRDLVARVGHHVGAAAGERRAVEHGNGLLDVAAGRSLPGLGKEHALALLADLRGEERDAHMIRIDAFRRLDVASRVVHLVLQERLFCRGENAIEHALEARASPRVIAVATNRQPIQLGRVVTGRRDERAAPHGVVRALQQAFELVVDRAAWKRAHGSIDRDDIAFLRAAREHEEGTEDQHQRGAAADPHQVFRWGPGRGPHRLAQVRGGGLEHFGMLDAVAAPGRRDEQAHALFRNGLVQEAIYGAARDLRRQQALVFVTARDDQHQIRELRFQAIAELVDRRGDERGIEHGDARMIVEQMRGEIRLGSDRGNIVVGRYRAQRLQQLAVVREHDETLADVSDDVMRRIIHRDAPKHRC